MQTEFLRFCLLNRPWSSIPHDEFPPSASLAYNWGWWRCRSVCRRMFIFLLPHLGLSLFLPRVAERLWAQTPALLAICFQNAFQGEYWRTELLWLQTATRTQRLTVSALEVEMQLYYFGVVTWIISRKKKCHFSCSFIPYCT